MEPTTCLIHGVMDHALVWVSAIDMAGEWADTHLITMTPFTHGDGADTHTMEIITGAHTRIIVGDTTLTAMEVDITTAQVIT